MQSSIKILLVEDELIIADYMQNCLQQYGYIVGDICLNYNEAVAALNTTAPDIVLLDITLKGDKSGIDLAQYINANYSVPFVFITSHSDKATIDKAKKTLPYAYLIKPFDESDLYAAIETALIQFGAKEQAKVEKESGEQPIIIKDSIFVRHKSKFVKILFDDLLWMEANDNYVILFANGGCQYVLKTSLKILMEVLPAFFWRIHRGYAVNLNHIKSFDSEEAIIGDKSLPIGRTYFNELTQRLRILNG
ncbi:MAG TPA: response regulator [Chitinophagaceae bacterium]|nr:response regulator [Chitinophagaceae bacterium]